MVSGIMSEARRKLPSGKVEALKPPNVNGDRSTKEPVAEVIEVHRAGIVGV